MYKRLPITALRFGEVRGRTDRPEKSLRLYYIFLPEFTEFMLTLQKNVKRAFLCKIEFKTSFVLENF